MNTFIYSQHLGNYLCSYIYFFIIVLTYLLTYKFVWQTAEIKPNIWSSCIHSASLAATFSYKLAKNFKNTSQILIRATNSTQFLLLSLFLNAAGFDLGFINKYIFFILPQPGAVKVYWSKTASWWSLIKQREAAHFIHYLKAHLLSQHCIVFMPSFEKLLLINQYDNNCFSSVLPISPHMSLYLLKVEQLLPISVS